MAAKFVVVPQWQGSASSRSMRLIDGAEAIRGDLPSSATTTVEIPLGAGDAVDTGVHRYSTLAVVRERLSMALQNLDPADTPIVVGGDCGVELAAVEHAAGIARAAGDRLGLVWFDANPDLHTPDSSPSGAFCGMVLRALLGDGAPGLVAEQAVAPGDVVLIGTRSEDDGEAAYLASTPIRMVRAEELDQVADAVDALDCDRVYVHIDLDVLDPGEFAGLTDPQPFGVSLADLTKAITDAVGSRRLGGAGIAMFAPATPAAANPDLPAVLRILSALTAPVRARA